MQLCLQVLMAAHPNASAIASLQGRLANIINAEAADELLRQHMPADKGEAREGPKAV